ncbi:MAG: TonB family protein [Gemmatimonadetes bacterium]|nr:TonB family protein [Gemmatimonadota bacterium]
MIALWIAYTVMISVLLSGAALGLEKALRLYGRSVRWVWAAVIAGGLAAPFLVLVLPMLPERLESVTVIPELPGVGPILLDPLVMAFTPPASLLEQLDAPLVGLWAAMTLGLLLMVTGGALRLARQRRSWTRRPLEGDRVLISENFGPAVVGLRRPEIVLPEWTLGLAPKDLHLVMLHEREHQKARDTQLLTAGLLSVLLTPWNLALWWQLGRLRGAVEVDCDARVMRSGVSGPEYGALLLRMGERMSGRGLAVAALTEPRSLLEGRLRMITEKKPEGRFARAAVAIVLTATALAVACETPTPSAVQQELDVEVAAQVVGQTESGSVVQIPGVVGLGDDPVRIFVDGVLVAIVEGSEKEGFRLNSDTPDEDRPRIFIDGELVEDFEIIDLNPDAIERIEVLKGAAAVEAYGDKGANGVIHIFLKPDQEVSAEREVDVSDGPVFTPMTVGPEIKNVSAVIQAMEQAYPQMLRDAGIGGRVVVWFFITETGEVADARISQASEFPALDDAALSVANVYEFTPARNGDKPVPVWVQFPITFEVR